jgi:hypothetical protein
LIDLVDFTGTCTLPPITPLHVGSLLDFFYETGGASPCSRIRELKKQYKRTFIFRGFLHRHYYYEKRE